MGGRQLRALGKLMPGEEEVARTLVPVVQFCVLQRGRTHDHRVTEALSKVKGSMGSHERHACLALSVTIFCDLGSCHSACHLHYFDGGDRGNHGAPYPFTTAQREQLVLERDALDIEWRT